MNELAVLPPATVSQRVLATLAVVGPYLATVYALIFQLRSPYLGTSLAIMAVMYLLTEFGIEGGFHRLITHRALEATRAAKIFLVVLGSMAGQGPVLGWAANHRRHHMMPDSEGDPHSPMPKRPGRWNALRGLFHAHVGWHFSVGQSSVVRFAPDLLVDPVVMRLNGLYWYWVALGLMLPAAAVGSLTGSWDGAAAGLLWGGLVRICLTQNFTWSVNSITHRYGTVDFKAAGNSKNNLWLAIPTLGQSWHNNHHAFPHAPTLNFKWWQLDLCGAMLEVLRVLGLVSYQKKAWTE